MFLIFKMLSVASEKRPLSLSLMQSFDNDYVLFAIYNQCCKQQLLAAASNSLHSQPHDILKPVTALQHSLYLFHSLMTSCQLTASQKSASSFLFFFFFL